MEYIKPENIEEYIQLVPNSGIPATHYTRVPLEDGWEGVIYLIKK